MRERARRVAGVAPELRHPALWVPFRAENPVVLWASRRGALTPAVDLPAGVTTTDRVLPASGGAPGVRVTLVEPPERPRNAPAVLYLHGGGFVAGEADGYLGVCGRVAERLGALVVNVDYRLAPEHPFPAGLDDCFAALTWLREHAAELGVDPARIAVAGDSAGGGLAACLVQRALDAGIPLAFQVLIYPMLDDRTCLVEPAEHRGVFIWTPESNRYGWSSYLGREPSRDGLPPAAAAARRVDLSGLAPAWIGVGDRDLFWTEDLRYAERLQQAGVPVQLETVPGMYHAADAVRPDAPLMRAFTASWMDALARGLGVQAAA